MQARAFKVRNATIEDVPYIEALASRFNFPLPEKFHTCAVIENEYGKIVAFAVIRTILEAVLVSDQHPRNVKQSVDLLVKEAKHRAVDLGYDYIYSFVPDETFSNWLEKFHNFKPTSGKGLILGVKDE